MFSTKLKKDCCNLFVLQFTLRKGLQEPTGSSERNKNPFVDDSPLYELSDDTLFLKKSHLCLNERFHPEIREK